MIRPEVIEFCQKIRRLANELEKETKKVNEKNQKVVEELHTKLEQAHQKQQQTVALENEMMKLKAVDEAISELIEESKEREKEYEVLYKHESAKLETIYRQRNELLSMQKEDGIEDFINLQEDIDTKLRQLHLVSRPSQEIAMTTERNSLVNLVHESECRVRSLSNDLQDLKKITDEMMGETFTTTEEERDEAINLTKELTQQLHGSYITSKLELHKYKSKERL